MAAVSEDLKLEDTLVERKPTTTASSIQGLFLGLGLLVTTFPTISKAYPNLFFLNTDVLSSGSSERYLGSNYYIRRLLKFKDSYLRWDDYIKPCDLIFFVTPKQNRLDLLEKTISLYKEQNKRLDNSTKGSFFFRSDSNAENSINYNFSSPKSDIPLLGTSQNVALDADGNKTFLINIANPQNYTIHTQPVIGPLPILSAVKSYRELKNDYSFNLINKTDYLFNDTNKSTIITNIKPFSFGISWISHIFYYNNFFQWTQCMAVLISESWSIIGRDSNLNPINDEFNLILRPRKSIGQKIKTFFYNKFLEPFGYFNLIVLGTLFGDGVSILSRYLRFITSSRVTQFAPLYIDNPSASSTNTSGDNKRIILVNKFSNFRLGGLNNGILAMQSFSVYSDYCKIERIRRNFSKRKEMLNSITQVSLYSEEEKNLISRLATGRYGVMYYDLRRKEIRNRVVNRICKMVCEIFINILDAVFFSESSSIAGKLQIENASGQLEYVSGMIASIGLGFLIGKIFIHKKKLKPHNKALYE